MGRLKFLIVLYFFFTLCSSEMTKLRYKKALLQACRIKRGDGGIECGGRGDNI